MEQKSSEITYHLSDENDLELPDGYQCPITREIMSDPVITASGRSYERKAIQAWFREGKRTDPMTGLPLSHQNLIPNVDLKKSIERFVSERSTLQKKALEEKELQMAAALREETLTTALTKAEEELATSRTRASILEQEIKHEPLMNTLFSISQKTDHPRKRVAEELMTLVNIETILDAIRRDSAANIIKRSILQYGKKGLPRFFKKTTLAKDKAAIEEQIKTIQIERAQHLRAAQAEVKALEVTQEEERNDLEKQIKTEIDSAVARKAWSEMADLGQKADGLHKALAIQQTLTKEKLLQNHQERTDQILSGLPNLHAQLEKIALIKAEKRNEVIHRLKPIDHISKKIDEQYKTYHTFLLQQKAAQESLGSHFSKSIEQLERDDLFKLAYQYEMGEGMPINLSRAVHFYQLAATYHHPIALYRLGQHLYFGEGIREDKEKAERLFKEAMPGLKALSDQGNLYAQTGLARCYEKGWAVNKNGEQAVKLYRLAADQNFVLAQNNLGECYQNGIGVKKDHTEALKWYTLAAEKECAVAQVNLGNCREEGVGYPKKDMFQAINWYRRAAERGNHSAQVKLAQFYIGDMGKDDAQAATWYRRAADQGSAHAQACVGWCYEYGRGVGIDLVQAAEWYRCASRNGFKEAQTLLDTLLRENPTLQYSVGNNPHYFLAAMPEQKDEHRSYALTAPN